MEPEQDEFQKWVSDNTNSFQKVEGTRFVQSKKIKYGLRITKVLWYSLKIYAEFSLKVPKSSPLGKAYQYSK